MKAYGLIGKSLKHSFSKSFFDTMFLKEKNDFTYNNFEIQTINGLFEHPQISRLCGFNVTIPYKQEVIQYLDDVKLDALKIGAVNCVKKEGKKWTGYNTDYLGFAESIHPLLKKHHKKALVLGSGGASKAITYAFENLLSIEHLIISRNSQTNYSFLDQNVIGEYHIIVNCTPLGTFPKTEEYPPIPYHFLNQNHLLFDLVYNPKKTVFLQKGNQQGCQIANGLEMLHIQAEKSWDIWRN